jgi:hypothetical protein
MLCSAYARKKTFSFADLFDDELFEKKCAAKLLLSKNLMIDSYSK